jgi:hypothetical protein
MILSLVVHFLFRGHSFNAKPVLFFKKIIVKVKMSFKLKQTANNPYPIVIKKELEILEVKTISQYNNNFHPIPFKKEPINNDERTNKLELENNLLKSKIYDLNEIKQVQSNEIIDLKLRLNKYEPDSNQIISREEDTSLDQNIDETSQTNQSEEPMLNLETDLTMSTCESDTDSDQSDYETTIQVINFNLDFFILNIFKFISRYQSL